MTLSFFRARGHGAPAALRADRLAPLPTLHCRKLGALPPPLAGEGWGGGGAHALSFCMPPPCPSPVNGGGDAGAAFPRTVASGPSVTCFAAMARAGMLACNDHRGFAVIAHGPHCHHRADAV